MADDMTVAEGEISVDAASIEDAFLAIPDDHNPPIAHAYRTYLITLISAVLFVAAVVIFIL